MSSKGMGVMRMYVDPKTGKFVVSFAAASGHWVKCNGNFAPFRCEGPGGCQDLIHKGDWYWRESAVHRLCRACANMGDPPAR